MWGDECALVCLNTEYGPSDPRLLGTDLIPTCDDGLWGHYEISRQPQLLDPSSPHLAFIEVPASENARSTRSFDFHEPRKDDVATSTNVNGLAQNSIFRSSDALHQKLEKRVKALQSNAEFALRVFEDAFKNLAKTMTPAQRRVANESKYPYSAISIM